MAGSPLFHKTLKQLRAAGIRRAKILVGISGGLDSVALLDVLSQLSSPQKLSLAGIHIDHGETSDPALAEYRKKAKDRAAAFCGALSLPCITPPPPEKPLKSEADFRGFRRAVFFRFLKEERAEWAALAHNSQDLLETRLIHLIRGCGEEGLKAMDVLNPPFLRPFLFAAREEIKSHAQFRGLKWVEDPSNSDERFLRNWIRRRWLPALEAKRPGGGDRLAGSLANLAALASGLKGEKRFASLVSGEGIDMTLFRELSPPEQKQVLAFYMRKRGLKGYGQSHIEEILKNLQRQKKRFSFRMLKKNWEMTGRRLRAKDLL